MKLLLWHWGRKGGGPMYTYEMAKALAAMPSVKVQLSLSRQSELWEQSQGLGLGGWSPDTYTGTLSAVWASVKLPTLRSEFSAYLRRERFDWVCGTMTHIWNPFMLRKVHQSRARYLMVLHDALLHPGERSPVRAKMLRAEVRRADAVVTLSEFVRAQAVEAYGLDPARLRVIPHGPFFYGQPKAQARVLPTGRPFRLLFFGRILAYKGLGLLLEAVRLLRQDFPEVELIVAGQGRLGDKNQAALRELGAKVINRWLEAGEVPRIIEEGDLLVAPYTSASQSGVLPLAYAHALPVVATQVGGLQEQVLPGKTGLLSGPPDAASLAHTMAKVMGDPQLYARLSAGARDYAAQGIAWPSLAKQLVETMKEAPR
ncbi:MAG: glycosyltransferase family 4 protein [Desulfarculus sp.]|nr:glycosyltransferase family 4 protein [Pseudomonadota bacterium]MBV1717646.1 glycosyltransferase family 4 protein [Desulfarculus sp.]MBU4573760.1 glycosyltransferase family 4 protein [Pseudomonadota bacterium]MBU4599187.1 glycosyltransferase family 4 protein [Pseudomonadota bacterium]MBV1739760.1 glycosyltransferase family 4 protein [Desulfarculus sp.]